jgi:hypothetical protein
MHYQHSVLQGVLKHIPWGVFDRFVETKSHGQLNHPGIGTVARSTT